MITVYNCAYVYAENKYLEQEDETSSLKHVNGPFHTNYSRSENHIM